MSGLLLNPLALSVLPVPPGRIIFGEFFFSFSRKWDIELRIEITGSDLSGPVIIFSRIWDFGWDDTRQFVQPFFGLSFIVADPLFVPEKQQSGRDD